MPKVSKIWQTLHSSKDQAWRTPAALYNALDKEFGFTLDAAASRNNKKCENYLGPDHPNPTKQNSLKAHWQGTVFCNPPYGRTVNQWVQHAKEQAQQGATVVMIVMACTDTNWWHEQAWKAAEIRLVQGRVSFNRSNGEKAAAAPKGSAILIFRPHVPHNGYPEGPRVVSWPCPK
jgi:phage N-6-adenine-methyltransferase